ncbi:hypothetical protein ACS0TY_005751 [Phlomoides rotata]
MKSWLQPKILFAGEKIVQEMDPKYPKYPPTKSALFPHSRHPPFIRPQTLNSSPEVYSIAPPILRRRRRFVDRFARFFPALIPESLTPIIERERERKSVKRYT